MERYLFNYIPTLNKNCLWIWDKTKLEPLTTDTFDSICIPDCPCNDLDELKEIYTQSKAALIVEGNLIISFRNVTREAIDEFKKNFLLGHKDVYPIIEEQPKGSCTKQTGEWTILIGTKVGVEE